MQAGDFAVAVPTDAELLASSTSDATAFGALYDRHVGAVLQFLVRRADSAETAADLCAETFAAAFVGRQRFVDDGSSALPWLYGIARRQLGHYWRRRRVSERARRRLGIGPLSLPDYDLERIDDLVDMDPLRQELARAVRQLSEIQRDAVVLRVCHELAYTEVAARLGCSEGAARVRVSRGLTRLADLMEDS